MHVCTWVAKVFKQEEIADAAGAAGPDNVSGSHAPFDERVLMHYSDKTLRVDNILNFQIKVNVKLDIDANCPPILSLQESKP